MTPLPSAHPPAIEQSTPGPAIAWREQHTTPIAFEHAFPWYVAVSATLNRETFDYWVEALGHWVPFERAIKPAST